MDEKVTYECQICGATKDVDESAPAPNCEECGVKMERAGAGEEEFEEDLEWDEEEE